MEQVYLCYECVYDGCDQWRNVARVHSDEVKALCWVEDCSPTEYNWREYEAIEVLS
jgi:hypothetical protein